MSQARPIRPDCNPSIARDSVPLAPIESTGPESARREGEEDEIDDEDAVWNRRGAASHMREGAESAPDAVAVEVEDHQIEAAAIPPVPISDEDDPTKVRDAVVEKGARDPGQPSNCFAWIHVLDKCMTWNFP